MSRKRLTPFGISRDGIPLTEAHVKNSIPTGITFGEYAGCVSEYHVMSAARIHGYRYYHEWQELTIEQQAKIVAHYLAEIAVSNHQKDAEIIASEKAQK